jgi:hypothetical protein
MKMPSKLSETFRKPDVIEFFRKQGSRGGKKSAALLTPEQRVARAKKAAYSLTAEQRRARALKAVAARETKRKLTGGKKTKKKKRALGHEVE